MVCLAASIVTKNGKGAFTCPSAVYWSVVHRLARLTPLALCSAGLSAVR